MYTFCPSSFELFSSSSPSYRSVSNLYRSCLRVGQGCTTPPRLALLIQYLSTAPSATSWQGVNPVCQFWQGGTRYPALKRVRGRDCFPSFCPSRTFSHRLQSHRRGCHPPFRGWGVVLASPFLPSDTISGCQTFPLLHKIIASTLASHIPRGHNENQGPYGGCIQSKSKLVSRFCPSV